MKIFDLHKHLEVIGQALVAILFIGMGLSAVSVAVGYTLFGI